MRFGGWFLLSLLVNVALFLWMRTLVSVESQEAVEKTKAAAVSVVEFDKLPPPNEPEPTPQEDARPQMNAPSAPPSMPSVAQPALNLAAARPTQGLAAPVVRRPKLGPMSVRGRMVTGAAPALSAGVGHGAGRAMKGITRAAPEPTLKVPPRYPPEALREGIEGHVKVSFVIDERGRPTKVRAQSAEPPGLFEKSAVRAVRKWSYPKQQRPLPAVVTLEFKMQGASR